MKIVDALIAYFKAAHGIELTGDNIAEVINAASDDVVLIVGLPAVTAADNGKILKVVDGAWAAVTAG